MKKFSILLVLLMLLTAVLESFGLAILVPFFEKLLNISEIKGNFSKLIESSKKLLSK